MAVARPRMLVTAGNTLTPVDAVRGITNVFTGRTGARIAAEATLDGYDVELLTSKPDVIDDTAADFSHLTLSQYQTFDDLAGLLEARVRTGGYDVIVHAAAVSDYRCVAAYAPPTGCIPPNAPDIVLTAETPLQRVDASAKIPSGHRELWLRLVPTTKLVDQIRRPWGYAGVLVKFKLEVGLSDRQLVERAQAAQKQSEADLVVANSLETMHDRAWLVDGSSIEPVERPRLPARLLARVGEMRRIR